MTVKQAKPAIRPQTTAFSGIFPDVVLSYQAWPNPRIVRPSDKPVSRDRPIVIVFNPAETT
jgi:hypothetical protein